MKSSSQCMLELKSTRNTYGISCSQCRYSSLERKTAIPTTLNPTQPTQQGGLASTAWPLVDGSPTSTMLRQSDPYEIKDNEAPSPPATCDIERILSGLRSQLPDSWIALHGTHGIDVLLLSRDEEKSVQRRASFTWSGQVTISVHRRVISEEDLKHFLLPSKVASSTAGEQDHTAFVRGIIRVIKTLQSYEVCVGVHEAEFEPLWALDKYGQIDLNPIGELRFQKTFRPFACLLLVPTAHYMRRRCSVCIKNKIRFRVKIQRHKSELANRNTPNAHLDRCQLLNKVTVQQHKLKQSRVQVAKLKAELRQMLCSNGFDISHHISDELMKICMAHMTWKSEI